MSRNGISKEIQAYLERPNATHPLFIAFDSSDDLRELVQELGSSFTTIQLSNSCCTDDAFPNLDLFFAAINNSRASRLLILGCGEYAELNEDNHFLAKLFELPCQAIRKIVVPIWNGFAFLETKRHDPRIDASRVLLFTSTKRLWRLKRIPENITLASVSGFRNILLHLERGYDGEMTIKTACTLNPKWCRNIASAFDLYCCQHPSTLLSSKLFSEQDWEMFLDDNRMQDNDLCSADSFLKLKLNPPTGDMYLQAVLDRTESFATFRFNLVTSILLEDANDSQFPALYAGWKEIMSRLSVEDVQVYLSEARRHDDKERIYYLSDNTIPERLEILSIISRMKRLSEILSTRYPQLWAYASQYSFAIQDSIEMSRLLTGYFDAYKHQKLFNELNSAFQETIETIAEERPYNMLPTRGAVLEKLKNDHVHLLWVDALGCEFLGFIQHRSMAHGLKISIHIARAKLPTLTSVNRDFYEEWDKGTKEQTKDLDKLKHGDFKDYGYDRSQIAVELVHELNVLEQLLSNIAMRLKTRKSKKVVLTSDHGTTRLAVISGNETIWELPEKGKHGGRCCRTSEYDGELPPFVAQDDDKEWNIMANYCRFKGGRKADVEVHGGAALEEVVVPVIEFELLDSSIRLELLTKEIKVSFRDDSIRLILFSTHELERLSVLFYGERYSCVTDNENPMKHSVILPKPKCGEHSISIFEGDSPLDTLNFTVQNAGIGIKKDNFF